MVGRIAGTDLGLNPGFNIYFMTLSKSFNFCGIQFAYLESGDDDINSLERPYRNVVRTKSFKI